jgi:hypothetical protein
LATEAAAAAAGYAGAEPAEFAVETYSRPPLADLEAKHCALIHEYLVALAACRQIPGFSFRLGIRSLVRLMARVHMKRRIAELGQAYAFIEQDFGPAAEVDPTYAEWLKTAQEQLDRLARALPLRRGVLAALSPAAFLPLIPVLVRIDYGGVGETINIERIFPTDLQYIAWPALAAGVAYSLGYVVIFVRASFATKRRFFHATISPRTRLQRLLGVRQLQRKLRDGTNIYALEDDLFSMLPTRRDREFPLDLVMWGLYPLVMFGMGIALFRATDPLGGWFLVSFGLPTGAAVVWAEVSVIASWRARTWR